MAFDKPDTVEVEKRKLSRLEGLVREMVNHIERSNLEHVGHQEYLTRRVTELEKLVREISPRRRPYDCMD